MHVTILLTKCEFNKRLVSQYVVDICRHLARGLKRDTDPPERAVALTIEMMRACEEQVDNRQTRWA